MTLKVGAIVQLKSRPLRGPGKVLAGPDPTYQTYTVEWEAGEKDYYHAHQLELYVPPKKKK